MSFQRGLDGAVALEAVDEAIDVSVRMPKSMTIPRYGTSMPPMTSLRPSGLTIQRAAPSILVESGASSARVEPGPASAGRASQYVSDIQDRKKENPVFALPLARGRSPRAEMRRGGTCAGILL